MLKTKILLFEAAVLTFGADRYNNRGADLWYLPLTKNFWSFYTPEVDNFLRLIIDSLPAVLTFGTDRSGNPRY